uniref:transposase n=1 Tax=Roseicitreum antarcticum TaxID=564137 RepID=UPI001CC20465|nr:transposase [Roseicitreum antarcticum]
MSLIPPTYRKVIREINHRYDPHFDYITHVDRKYLNNRVESDHAALKRLLGYRQSFRSLRCAKATLLGMEAIRTIKHTTKAARRPRRDQLRPRALWPGCLKSTQRSKTMCASSQQSRLKGSGRGIEEALGSRPRYRRT